MSIAASLLPEFDHEAATTRRVLERVPWDRHEWAPHPKSMTMQQLSTHVARLPGWTAITIAQDSFDVGDPESGSFEDPLPGSTDELVALFDRNVATARAALEGASDATLFQPWTLKSGETDVFTLPRVAVLRSFVMNHLVHHRGQLSVYLRMNDVPVPSIYGPSADESKF